MHRSDCDWWWWYQKRKLQYSKKNTLRWSKWCLICFTKLDSTTSETDTSAMQTFVQKKAQLDAKFHHPCHHWRNECVNKQAHVINLLPCNKSANHNAYISTGKVNTIWRKIRLEKKVKLCDAKQRRYFIILQIFFRWPSLSNLPICVHLQLISPWEIVKTFVRYMSLVLDIYVELSSVIPSTISFFVLLWKEKKMFWYSKV